MNGNHSTDGLICDQLTQIQSIHQRLGRSLSEQLWKTRDPPLHLGLPQILAKTRLAHTVPFAHWRGLT